MDRFLSSTFLCWSGTFVCMANLLIQTLTLKLGGCSLYWEHPWHSILAFSFHPICFLFSFPIFSPLHFFHLFQLSMSHWIHFYLCNVFLFRFFALLVSCWIGMWIACQLHCAYEEKCPERLSDALNLLAEPMRPETGFLTSVPAPALEITVHLLIGLKSQRASDLFLCVHPLYQKNLPRDQSWRLDTHCLRPYWSELIRATTYRALHTFQRNFPVHHHIWCSP